MKPPARGRPSQPGRGRGPVRWTVWEISLIVLSIVMIAFPLYAEATRLVFAPVAPAQENPTATPDLAFPPTNTPLPPPTETPLPDLTPTTDPISPQPSPSGTGTNQGPTLTPTNTPLAGTPSATSTGEPATPTTEPGSPTPTAEPGSPTPTAEPGSPTPTAEPGSPTATAEPGSPTPTAEPVSPTATFTVIPTVVPSPTSDVPPTGITIFKIASSSQVAQGQQFSYNISVVSTSTANQAVRLQDNLDANLEFLGLDARGGSCSGGQTIVCDLTVNSGNSASITLQVRVRPSAAVGTTINNVATAPGAETSGASIRVLGGTPGPSTTPVGPSPTAAYPFPTTPVVPSPTTPVGPSPTTPVGPSPTTPLLPSPTTPPVVVPTTPPGVDPTVPPVVVPPAGEPAPPATSLPIAPPAPPTPQPAVPTEPPTPAPPPPGPTVIRPTAAPRPPSGGGSTGGSSAATSTPVQVTATTAVTPSPGLGGNQTGSDVFFRMASDWGSAYPGQIINYTLVVRNTRSAAAGGANDLRTVNMRTLLPSNLEVLGARADRGTDPTITGNEIRHAVEVLQPGESVELTINTRIKTSVTAGTLLVAQGQLTYAGRPQELFSNIVSVQVVGSTPPTVGPTFTPTVDPTSTPDPGPSPVPPGATAVPTSTPAPGAPSPTPVTTPPAGGQPDPQPTSEPGGKPPGETSPLPETSTGVPLIGVLMLGLTLLTRTWRLHRAKERI
ncbi:hypothetical protein EYB53_007705 [Candidatus Chloroploca sp. M-50]|uniref:DUF11 domain-containing protein n=1 Tax=Candidatus Chloroploca mongolica TaxID=2528176 RepID=A0ABS4D825_9CHLR|nr:DUF11 domain-containing protein [Candidatus Chloroploca mongolica]MBP1465588.1 hypothetical protein [Candidatus Chloroploca mongolica]